MILKKNFRKSYLSMSRDSLLLLHQELTEAYRRLSSAPVPEESASASPSSTLSHYEEDSIRLLLTSIDSLRLKVNNPTHSLQTLLTEALARTSKRLGRTTSTPAPVPSFPVESKDFPSPSPSPSPLPKASPSSPQKSVPTSEIQSRPSLSTPFPHPLIFGPLRHEATNVQELYYLPLAQLHNQLFILTQQSIKRAIALGWQGEPTQTPDRPWSSCFAPNAERSHLQQQIIKLDNQLQNFWNRYHLAIDEINGVKISEQTKLALAQETKKVDSPSLAVSKQKPLGSYTKKEIDSNLLPTDLGLEEVISARQERNKKLLRRRDRQKSETHKSTLIEAATELHEWGIYIEEAQARTCSLYGFDVPQDWLRPTPTDEERRLAHNASQKKHNDKKCALKREMKAAFQAEVQAQFQDLLNTPSN